MTDDWRFIDTGLCSAAHNMALDETIATSVRKDNAPPTLRLYGWDMPSVSIGCFQRISDVDIEYCTEKYIPIVRRPTGGRAILHNNEITYSFSVKTTYGLFSKGLLDSYKRISHAFNHAFSKLGIFPEIRLPRKIHQLRSPLCFQSTSYGEITIDNKKVVGSAQKRWTDCLLQQGSIPFTTDKDELAKVFRLNLSFGIRDTFIGLKEILPELDTDDLKNIIRTSFEETFNTYLIPSLPLQEEVSLAQELEAQKYLSHQWNFTR